MDVIFLKVDTPLFRYNRELNKSTQNIYLFQQWFISNNYDRHRENIHVLQRNIENPHITRIYLLNEREYDWTELGVDYTDKIVQVVITDRLTYSIAWNKMKELDLDGYCILANLDIFFDEQLEKLYYTDYDTRPVCITGARREYYPITDVSADTITRLNANLKHHTYELPNTNGSHPVSLYQDNLDAFVVPRSILSNGTQDVWIIHSYWLQQLENSFDVQLGTFGCDNKVVIYLHQSGFEIINGTYELPMYHYHVSEYRTYDRIHPDGYYGKINTHLTKEQIIKIHKVLYYFYQDEKYMKLTVPLVETEYINTKNKLMGMITNKQQQNKSFYVSCFESTSMMLSQIYSKSKTKQFIARDINIKPTGNEFDNYEYLIYRWCFLLLNETQPHNLTHILHYITSLFSFLDTNSTILERRMNHIEHTLEKSDIILYTEIDVKQVKSVCKEIKIINHILNNKEYTSFYIFNPLLFHNHICWTHSLHKQRIGIVSYFNKEIKSNLKNINHCYPTKLFIHNSFSFFDIPEIDELESMRIYKRIVERINHTKPSNQEHIENMREFYESIRKTSKITYLEYISYIDRFKEWAKQVDVVLFDAQPYHLLLSHSCIQQNTSFIVLDKFLRLYFGVYTEHDEKIYSELLNVRNMRNKYWRKV